VAPSTQRVPNLASKAAQLNILKHERVNKAVNHVSQNTFSGERALQRGQQVPFITERAAFRLKSVGVEPIEVAPAWISIATCCSRCPSRRS
jgi:propionate CoA-transferase